ncbi:carboxylesterase family protein-like protein [Bimuria novae-zelandiae CBS 107.79]|uniref:Carboxylic ester hydrolase n=1 Tax=Bimuria novae-zelandiae CBS 107.79 TaxID=1447943 RepID=A0A6A5UVN8_9PLEO|nr:carboxylesterase family protein-like protein [Bimuria novae-zelandiae CBS 107.79]
MRRCEALVFGLLVGLTNASPVASGSRTPIAKAKNGTYVGVHSSQYNQDFFLGIPYAQPPVGDLRFKPPVSLNESWKKPKQATKYSPACYGYGSDQWNYPVSEDCLYLNVVRPAGYEHQALPVAFWIHGGGFYQGSGVDQRYNLSYMVQNSVEIGKPIIGVTINYRLSAFGFLSGSQELLDEGSTNVGLRDQRLALHWVQENIKAFGGDKKKVTIWGESAGAASVGFHITAYNGRDDKLFRGAAMQSGNPIFYSRLNSSLDNAPMYNELLARTSCSTVECLRGLSEGQLNAAINSTSSASYNRTLAQFRPFKDDDFIADYGSRQLADGRYVKVPIIEGATSDEGSAFSPRGINTTADFRAAIQSNAPVSDALADQLLEAYPDDPSVNVIANLGDARPGPPYGSQFRRSASYWGDWYFIANRRKTCETWAAAKLSAYCFRFNAIPAGIPPEVGVTHFQDVAFVFNNIQGSGYIPAATPPFTGKGQNYINLAKLMDSSWVSFFHDQDPNSWKKSAAWNGTEENWPVYDVNNPRDFVFDANVTSYAEADTYRQEGIQLINANNFPTYGR